MSFTVMIFSYLVQNLIYQDFLFEENPKQDIWTWKPTERPQWA